MGLMSFSGEKTEEGGLSLYMLGLALLVEEQKSDSLDEQHIVIQPLSCKFVI